MKFFQKQFQMANRDQFGLMEILNTIACSHNILEAKSSLLSLAFVLTHTEPNPIYSSLFQCSRNTKVQLDTLVANVWVCEIGRFRRENYCPLLLQ